MPIDLAVPTGCVFCEGSIEFRGKERERERVGREKYHNHGCNLRPPLHRLGCRQSSMHELTKDSDIWECIRLPMSGIGLFRYSRVSKKV